ncbi:MAG: A/G-specific adenine glycosylase [Bacteriovoracaceae bacterium]
MKELIDWSYGTYRHLPWRKERDLYKTLVSEIMLQQTTVSTVLNHFDRFLNLFPTIQSLAKADSETVQKAWSGLGYYRRARSLHSAAQYIVSQLDGEIPLDFEELISIPGIGPYTANALIAIGADQRALAVDANIERVVARMFKLEQAKGPKLQKEIEKLFQDKKIFHPKPKAGWRALNEALMDLGRVYCQARKANCSVCPAKESCLTKLKGHDPLNYPKGQKEKVNKFHSLKLLRVIVKKGNQYLMVKKKENEWLSGQLELPTFILSSDDKSLKQYPYAPEKVSSQYVTFAGAIFKSSITKYKIENVVAEMNPTDFARMIKSLKIKDDYQWIKAPVENHHISTATIKSLRALI